jgi:hypothetical protein
VRSSARACNEQAVRLAQKTQVGPCIPMGVQLEKAEVGPTSGPTWRLPHLLGLVRVHRLDDPLRVDAPRQGGPRLQLRELEAPEARRQIVPAARAAVLTWADNSHSAKGPGGQSQGVPEGILVVYTGS